MGEGQPIGLPLRRVDGSRLGGLRLPVRDCWLWIKQLVQRAEQTSSFGSEIFYGFALQGTGRPTTDLQDCHCFFGCKFHRETEAS